ncbi:predicted protein [Streptomyces viridosporus ATCC 14672]|uniref:Predicted protein n=1 Tax=Streptomyces viridosporus (strain ATCC 14672 / DSM 40746 / JCM 4963 / KCTC 9882 / NRRL B-12104 / FH 1290) TaxID=566461 RepID=D6AA53_STRV1|nr:hypothetical protein [Streptomyces viridosporus]EFE72148.1 predicted protein [Streptomyces viridosporus ATCC 14672]
MKKRLAQAAVGLAFGLAALGTTPASAISQAAAGPAAAAACSRLAGTPYHDDGYVFAYVSSSGCSGHQVAVLERHRWYGWETIDRWEWDGNGGENLLEYCEGDGTYTYRASFPFNGVTGPSARFTC